MINRVLVLLAITLLCLSLYPLLTEVSPAEEPGEVSEYYLENAKEDLNTANIVTAVVVTYRGLDTLGEIAILFAAAAGVGVLLKGMRSEKYKRTPASEIVRTGAGFLFPLLLIFGAYIFIHGHLTPGGGFQGGVIIASAVAMLFIAGISEKANDFLLRFIESVSGAAYIAIGILGLILAAGFLDNRIFSLGEFGKVFSSGAIPVIYSLIGLKVGSELSGIIDKLKGSDKSPEGAIK